MDANTDFTLSTDPVALFSEWMRAAEASEPNDPNAMCLATVGADGRPSARIVLLKSVDAGGFMFHSHYTGRKGRELDANPCAALCFHWKSLRRQVRVEGRVEHATPAESDAYYASRARISRLGAWASRQSEPLADRAELEARLREAVQRFPDEEVPRPEHWGGFRLIPDSIEFWEDRPGRQHWRTRFVKTAGGWESGLLYP